MAFKKTFSYAGFEMQPKKYKNPKIALLNVELELKAEKENAEIRIDNVEVSLSYIVILIMIDLLKQTQSISCRNTKKLLMQNGVYFMIN